MSQSYFHTLRGIFLVDLEGCICIHLGPIPNNTGTHSNQHLVHCQSMLVIEIQGKTQVLSRFWYYTVACSEKITWEPKRKPKLRTVPLSLNSTASKEEWQIIFTYKQNHQCFAKVQWHVIVLNQPHSWIYTRFKSQMLYCNYLHWYFIIISIELNYTVQDRCNVINK